MGVGSERGGALFLAAAKGGLGGAERDIAGSDADAEGDGAHGRVAQRGFDGDGLAHEGVGEGRDAAGADFADRLRERAGVARGDDFFQRGAERGEWRFEESPEIDDDIVIERIGDGQREARHGLRGAFDESVEQGVSCVADECDVVIGAGAHGCGFDGQADGGVALACE